MSKGQAGVQLPWDHIIKVFEERQQSQGLAWWLKSIG
jgi:hypothetical protein